MVDLHWDGYCDQEIKGVGKVGDKQYSFLYVKHQTIKDNTKICTPAWVKSKTKENLRILIMLKI